MGSFWHLACLSPPSWPRPQDRQGGLDRDLMPHGGPPSRGRGGWQHRGVLQASPCLGGSSGNPLNTRILPQFGNSLRYFSKNPYA